MKARISILASLLAFACVTSMMAVNYQTPYKGQRYYDQSAMSQSIASTPVVSFQSTSAYSGQWNQEEQQSMLNGDGTVSDEYYGVGGRIRRVGGPTPGGGVNGPGTPTPNPDPENQQPLGDALWVLLLMAIGYACYRRKAGLL